MKKRVAVLRGGPSSEYNVSMLSGNAVLRALAESDEYEPVDVSITKSGDWLTEGRTKQPLDILQAVDVVFIALHGEYGEDGQIQRMLDQHSIPYTGSGSFSSARAFNKVHAKDHIAEHVTTPTHCTVKRHHIKDPRTLTRISEKVGDIFFAKPVASGSSVGARKITTEEDVASILEELLTAHNELLLEEYIEGTEATVAVLENYRDQSLYVMPVIEIVPPSHVDFFDETVKYNGTTKEIVPGNFAPEIRDELQRLALLAHKTLECSHYSRSDFIVRDGKVYYLETNTLPGLTEESLYPKAAASVGLSFADLIHHLINNALI